MNAIQAVWQGQAYRRAMAQLQFRARTYEEGDATFTALVKDYPNSATVTEARAIPEVR
ncbi:hypothetical protein [Endozoicomonas sp. GU-1]|uniref:hypothetical protein n=1 Tax=Endozoicomonas sp. GU-1 TaxID=3009078 RepID=UPI0022B2F182|nr:hypothetical protein [Endozoicomonas sp. GU-1]WBA81411.1 hypothetical protein O2T12_24565 [Endozoicomonas sp. GU-1]WBA84359.1 hypothetical protein O3276_13730 [Endozoicomonas sp. GU-1]